MSRLSRNNSRRGFTLLEMATCVAALIIILGVMVSLARYVRNELAVEVTKDLLHKMDELLQQYRLRHSDRLPAIASLVPPEYLGEQLPDEGLLQKNAEQNNRELLRVLRLEGLLREEAFGGLPKSIYNDAVLRDAWGSPIVYMPAMHQGIGMSPHDQPFFFSAGPDQQYRTQEDNLYSYEK